MVSRPRVAARAWPVPEALRSCFSAIYHFEIICPPGQYLEDCLHPEWATIRFTDGPVPARLGFVPEPLREYGLFTATGPSSRALRFAVPSARFVSIGLRAAGWARFVPVSAGDMADRIVAGGHPAFALFSPLLEEVRAPGVDEATLAGRVSAFLCDLDRRFAPAPARVVACQEALWHTDIGGVAQLA